MNDSPFGRAANNRGGSSALPRAGSSALPRVGSTQALPRRGSSSHLHSHLPPRRPESQRHSRQQDKQNRVKLLLFVIIIGAFIFIAQQRIFGTASDEDKIAQAHRKNLRVESHNLRDQFTGLREDALKSQDQSTEVKAELHAAAEAFKTKRSDSQQELNIGVNSDLQQAHEENPVLLSSSPTPEAPDLDLLNVHAGNLTALLHDGTAQLPPEDFSAAGLDQKRQAVKEAAIHSWKAYEEHAWGYDELQPVTQDGKQTLGGLGATIIDSLTTLWLMDLKDEFSRAREWVAAEFMCNVTAKISLFETNIRVVGGLISAYDLSGDKLFLDKAVHCVEMMLPIFDTSLTGIPNNIVRLQVNGKKKARLHGSLVSLAEFGSFGVEFYTLSQRTGNQTYADTAEHVYRWLHEQFPDMGLMPIRLNRNKGKWSSMKTYTLGAMADSYYEYLLKMWLLKQQKDDMYRAMWEAAMDDMMVRLLNVSVSRHQYVGMIQQNAVYMPRMEHLTCYLPGNLALGVAYGAVTGPKAEHYMSLAQNLTYTCWQMYDKMPVGLAPEMVWFHPTDDMQAGVNANMLRPEVLESIFYMYRFTGDPMYQQWAWRIFQAFETYSKLESGYAGIEDVTVIPPVHDNVMQSFWLAETLKYLYLLFSPPSTMPLDKWLLNTEAHPIKLQPPLHSLLQPKNQLIVPLI